MRKLRLQRIDFEQIGRFLAGAAKKLAAARKTLGIDEEASYQLAYEAMLKASLGFMLSFGVRPRSLPGHHIAIIEFCGQRLGSEHKGLMALFDRMRRKRHQSVYDATGFISKYEAQQALETAEQYLSVLREEIRKRNPGPNLPERLPAES